MSRASGQSDTSPLHSSAAPGPVPLRARQAAVARDAILDTLVSMLEREDSEDISMEVLAERAGTSRRTLYRYFPTRGDLLDAAADWIYEHRLRLPREIRDATEIPDSFLQASAEIARHPRLARVLLNSETGRSMHNSRRAGRTQAIRDVLAPIASHLPDDQAAERIEIITYLCSSRSWITLQDQSDLSAAQARTAVAWALSILITALQHQHHAATSQP